MDHQTAAGSHFRIPSQLVPFHVPSFLLALTAFVNGGIEAVEEDARASQRGPLAAGSRRLEAEARARSTPSCRDPLASLLQESELGESAMELRVQGVIFRGLLPAVARGRGKAVAARRCHLLSVVPQCP
jgi:hypothetical protein